jgi:tetratricopeptide (TPR) repeat protein
MRFVQGDSLREAIEAFHREPARNWSAGETLLRLRALLGRFIGVCHAVEYAHSRGVLHRDLKPGNIMLGKYGETLVVDWGLAKAIGRDDPHLDSRPAEAMICPTSECGVPPTEMGQLVGTAAYMSPEQASGRVDQIGKPSDVYSLGATLYCLLTGQAPFVDKDVEAIVEKVRRGDYQPPRRVNPRIPRALESICLRAMAHRPPDRYASPGRLVQDLERWLAHESVLAHRESLGERLTRLGRRYKTAVRVAMIGLFAVAAVATAAAFLINEQKNQAEQLAVEKQQLAEANSRIAISERQSKEGAQQAAKRTQRVLDYLVSAFRRPDPEIDGRKVTVASVLEQALRDLDNQLVGDPLEKAALLHAIGQTYRGLGMYSSAIGPLEQAVAIRRQQLGESHPDTMTSMNELSLGYESAGQFEKVLPLRRKTLDLRRAALGDNHPDVLKSMNNLARGYHAAGQLDKALPLMEETLKLTRATLGESHLDTLTQMNNLAGVYHEMGQLDKALPLFKKIFESRRALLGEDHPRTLISMNNLAGVYQSLGQFDMALPLWKKALELRRVKLGDDHPNTLFSMNNLAFCYEALGQLDKALPLFETTLELSRAKLGENHPNTLMSMLNLASCYQKLGQLAQAIRLNERTLELTRAKLGDEHPDTLAAMNSLANAYEAAGQVEKALPLFEKTLDLMRTKLGENHFNTMISMSNLASAYRAGGQLDKAIPLHERTLTLIRDKLGEDHPNTLGVMGQLAHDYYLADRLSQALPLFERARELRRRRLGDDHPDTLTSMSDLAIGYEAAGQLERALPLFEQTLELRRTKLGEDHPDTRASAQWLNSAHLETRDFVNAERTSRLWLTVLERLKSPAADELAQAKTSLAEALLEQEKLDEALENVKSGLDSQTDDHANSVLGGVFAKQGKWDEAEPLLLDSYRNLKLKLASTRGHQRWRVARVCERIVGLYEAQGKTDEVAKWQAELVAIQAEIARLRK